MEKEIYKADPEFRKLALMAVCIFAVVGVVSIALLSSFVKSSALEADPTLGIRYMYVYLNSLVLPPLGLAVYLIYIAIKSRRQDRFPPEGMKVVKDMELLRGTKAQRKAAVLMVLAVTLIACCIAAVVSANLFLNALMGTL